MLGERFQGKPLYNPSLGRSRKFALPWSSVIELAILGLIFGIALGLSLVLRLAFAKNAVFPGHADYSYYYSLATNLVEGRGFTIDYIWQFLSQPNSVTHYSNDYWMPFTAIIISLAFTILGKSISSALLPSVLFGIGLGLPTYLFGMIYSGSKRIAALSAAIVFLIPSFVVGSLLTDSMIYYSFFVCMGLVLVVAGIRSPKYLIPAAALAGLAHITRQDGFLLLPITILGLAISPLIWKQKFRYLVFCLAAYAICIAPILIANQVGMGTVFPTGTSKTLFFTYYEQLYSFSTDLSFRSFWDWGIQNIVHQINLTTKRNLVDFYGMLNPFLWILFGLGWVRAIHERGWRPVFKVLFPVLVYFAGLFFFYSVVATFPSAGGSFVRSSTSLLPFVIVVAIDAVERVTSARYAPVLAVAILIVPLFNSSMTKTIDQFSQLANQWKQMNLLSQALRNDSHPWDCTDSIIMTRNPWEVNLATGCKAVQIPNEDLDTIYSVAQQFHANVLLLPAPREALNGLYQETVIDSRFKKITSVPDTDLKLFQIVPRSILSP